MPSHRVLHKKDGIFVRYSMCITLAISSSAFSKIQELENSDIQINTASSPQLNDSWTNHFFHIHSQRCYCILLLSMLPRLVILLLYFYILLHYSKFALQSCIILCFAHILAFIIIFNITMCIVYILWTSCEWGTLLHRGVCDNKVI